MQDKSIIVLTKKVENFTPSNCVLSGDQFSSLFDHQLYKQCHAGYNNNIGISQTYLGRY